MNEFYELSEEDLYLINTSVFELAGARDFEDSISDNLETMRQMMYKVIGKLLEKIKKILNYIFDKLSKIIEHQSYYKSKDQLSKIIRYLRTLKIGPASKLVDSVELKDINMDTVMEALKDSGLVNDLESTLENFLNAYDDTDFTSISIDKILDDVKNVARHHNDILTTTYGFVRSLDFGVDNDNILSIMYKMYWAIKYTKLTNIDLTNVRVTSSVVEDIREKFSEYRATCFPTSTKVKLRNKNEVKNTISTYLKYTEDLLSIDTHSRLEDIVKKLSKIDKKHDRLTRKFEIANRTMLRNANLNKEYMRNVMIRVADIDTGIRNLGSIITEYMRSFTVLYVMNVLTVDSNVKALKKGNN